MDFGVRITNIFYVATRSTKLSIAYFFNCLIQEIFFSATNHLAISIEVIFTIIVKNKLYQVLMHYWSDRFIKHWPTFVQYRQNQNLEFLLFGIIVPYTTAYTVAKMTDIVLPSIFEKGLG